MLLLLPAVTASPETAGIANVVWTTSMSDAQRTASQDLRALTTCENSNGDCYSNPCGYTAGGNDGKPDYVIAVTNELDVDTYWTVRLPSSGCRPDCVYAECGPTPFLWCR